MSPHSAGERESHSTHPNEILYPGFSSVLRHKQSVEIPITDETLVIKLLQSRNAMLVVDCMMYSLMEGHTHFVPMDQDWVTGEVDAGRVVGTPVVDGGRDPLPLGIVDK